MFPTFDKRYSDLVREQPGLVEHWRVAPERDLRVTFNQLLEGAPSGSTIVFDDTPMIRFGVRDNVSTPDSALVVRVMIFTGGPQGFDCEEIHHEGIADEPGTEEYFEYMTSESLVHGVEVPTVLPTLATLAGLPTLWGLLRASE